MSDECRTEAEFLEREARLAREALQRLRGEMFDSLKRTADAAAWTREYPWQSLGTAAIAGLGTGWALGSTFRRNRSADSSESAGQTEAVAESAEAPSAASRLVGGLGTLTGALASAAFTAAAEAIKDIVTESVHNAIHPEPDVNAPPDDDTNSPDDATTSEP
ncbi:MAG TPA: hypothetical protein VMJ32_10195 [Pirellulales bacterium]|nr:hypothetical protein [Pirellulales bacterium]